MLNEALYKEGDYLRWNPSWHVEDSPWKANQIMNMIEKNSLKPNSICEIGCGAGEILHQLCLSMPGNISFVGYEISPQAFAFCQQRTKERLKFYLKDFLEENSAYFDIVMAIDVFEHIEDYLGFLRRLHGKSRYHIFHIPLDLSVQSVWRSFPILRARQSVGHLHYFTKETALATLTHTGYEILDYFYTAGSIDLPAESFTSWLARSPRRMMRRLSEDMAARLLGGFSLLVLTK
jgi:hypothetical protein